MQMIRNRIRSQGVVCTEENQKDQLLPISKGHRAGTRQHHQLMIRGSGRRKRMSFSILINSKLLLMKVHLYPFRQIQ